MTHAQTAETKSLIEALLKAGFKITEVNDGEELVDMADAEVDTIVEACTAVDEAYLFVTTPDGKELWLRLIYGNGPGELVCDYSVHPLLDLVTSEESAKWEVRQSQR